MSEPETSAALLVVAIAAAVWIVIATARALARIRRAHERADKESS